MDYADFGHRIRKLRHGQGSKQQELAERAGLTASFLGHIERGTRIASLETLVVLCAALRTTPNHLLAGSLAPFRTDVSPDKENELVKKLLLHTFDIVNAR